MSMLANDRRNVNEWDVCLPACLIGLRMFQHKVLGLPPYTIVTGLAPRLPVKHMLMREPNVTF